MTVSAQSVASCLSNSGMMHVMLHSYTTLQALALTRRCLLQAHKVKDRLLEYNGWLASLQMLFCVVVLNTGLYNALCGRLHLLSAASMLYACLIIIMFAVVGEYFKNKVETIIPSANYYTSFFPRPFFRTIFFLLSCKEASHFCS